MAKDKVKICIGETVRIDSLYTISKHWKYVNTKDSDYWFCKIGNYYIHYSLIPGTNNIGYLTIDFSISKLLNDDNALPTTQVNPYTIKERIYSDLKTVLNFKSNSILGFEEWTISKDETFFDIIASKEVIESLMHLIEHSDIHRRTVDPTYIDKGSIYIHSGDSKGNASCTLIAYDKIKEGASRGVDIAKLKRLKEGQGCLRLELKTKGYSLKKLLEEFNDKYILKPNVSLINSILDKTTNLDLLYNDNYHYKFDYKKLLKTTNYYSDTNIKCSFKSGCFDNSFSLIPTEYITNLNQQIKYYPFKFFELLRSMDNKAYFIDTLNPNFQAYLLYKVLKDLNLFNIKGPLKIFSRKKLLKFIRKGEVFKRSDKKENAKEIVKFLNGPRDKKPFCDKTMNDYKNTFLNTGIHYIYVDHPIPEISQAMLDKAIYETGNLVIE